MNALNEIVGYLLQTLLSLYLIAMLLRFLLQVVRADFYNPISQFLVKITNPVVVPLRRVIPGLGGIDLASLALVIAIHAAYILTYVFFRYGVILDVGQLVLGSLLGVVGLLVYFYFFALLAMIILSWVAGGSQHPVIYLLHQITEPVMAPFRRALPAMGGLDFSPILVFILINVIQIALRNIAASLGIGGIAPWL